MNRTFLLSNIKICLGDSFNPEEGYGILVDNGIIKRIAPLTELNNVNVPVEDGGGAFVLPGLIDCHSHLSLDCALTDYLMRMNNSETELAIIAVKTLKRDLLSGVTTSRCMGDRFFIDVFCRKAVETGFLQGPELKVSGIGMRASAGHGFVGMPFDGIEELKEAVRSNIEKDVDWIKFYSTGTVTQDGQIRSFYSKPEIACIIDEAHRAGKPVTSHCIGGIALLNSVELGIDCIEHAYYAGETEVEALLKRGITVCLTPSEYFTDKANAPAESQAKFKANRDVVAKSMDLIIKSGITFVLGTDGMHGELAQEANYAVQFGASPEAALAALTSNAAKLLGINDKTGSLKEGLQADLLLVRDNPLRNIESLKNVLKVYQKGKVVTG